MIFHSICVYEADVIGCLITTNRPGYFEYGHVASFLNHNWLISFVYNNKCMCFHQLIIFNWLLRHHILFFQVVIDNLLWFRWMDININNLLVFQSVLSELLNQMKQFHRMLLLSDSFWLLICLLFSQFLLNYWTRQNYFTGICCSESVNLIWTTNRSFWNRSKLFLFQLFGKLVPWKIWRCETNHK